MSLWRSASPGRKRSATTKPLQDVEAGRAVEIDALVGTVLELGKLTQTPTPSIDAVYACVSLLAKTLAQEGGRLRVEKIQ